jgi:hypothetical protein
LAAANSASSRASWPFAWSSATAFQFRLDAAVAEPADRHVEEAPKGIQGDAGELNHPSFLPGAGRNRALVSKCETLAIGLFRRLGATSHRRYSLRRTIA